VLVSWDDSAAGALAAADAHALVCFCLVVWLFGCLVISDHVLALFGRYQGEANANEAPNEYQCELESLAAEWRGAFDQSTMPFFVVQLAPYWEAPSSKQGGIGANYPAIRIAQARAMANAETETGAPSGICITHDIGDVAGGIHPHNKTEVGRRLALEIRAKVLGVRGLPRITEPIGPVRAHPSQSELLIQFTSDARAVSELGWGGTHNCSECCTRGPG
jgi:hypothetical protein